jgi:hypothetical protein
VQDPEPQEEAQERVRSCGLQRKRVTVAETIMRTFSYMKMSPRKAVTSLLAIIIQYVCQEYLCRL